MDSHSQDKRKKKAIATLIASTKRAKRLPNLLEVAHEIRWLQDHMGSLGAVAQTLGISEEMLREFLSVERLPLPVRELISNGSITSVDVAYRISRLDPADQETVAKRFAAGELSSKDVRMVLSLRKNLPGKSIREVIDQVLESRDVRVFVAYFRAPADVADEDSLRLSLEDILGSSEIRSFRIRNEVATLELTPVGRKKLAEAARTSGSTIREFVNNLVAGKAS